MTLFNNMYSRSTKINIVELRLQETGTFNQQFHRPYEAIIRHDALESLSRRIEGTIHRNSVGRVDNDLVSGMSDGLITVSATPDQPTGIVNGWNERRFRFTMTVSIQTGFAEELCYLQGYSEYFDVSHGNNINPKLVFFINSYTRVSRMTDPTNPVGGYIDRVLESRQVLNGMYGANNASQLYGIRPEDLFIGVQSSYLSQGISDTSMPLTDTRIGLVDKTFSNNRNNAIPCTMMSGLINTWREAETLVDFGQGNENVYDRAIQKLHEKSPMDNAFIAALSQLQNNGISASAWFTLEELARIDPTMQQRVYYSPLESNAMVHSVGMTSDWGAADKQTQIAYMVANSTASLMQASGLVTAHFFATNITIGNQISVEMTAPGISFSTSDPVSAYTLFTSRFATEVMPDLTANNLIPVAITVSADIYNETHVTVSIDGRPGIPFAYPSFADSLLQSTMTVDRTNYNSLITGVEEILNYVGINKPVMSNFIQTV